MRFADVTGHTGLKEMLMRGAVSGRISHAVMFTGAPGYGTLPLALAYARYVNCTSPSGGDSCGECASCRKYSVLQHPDLHFVYPVNASGSSGRKLLSDGFARQWRDIVASSGGYFNESDWYGAIDIANQQGIISRVEADEVLRKLSFKSFEARYKTMIIWLPERMHPEAANALLKILEEPWERTLFILVSADPGKLLDTIVSRVQQISVPGIPTDEIAGRLIADGVSGPTAQEAARLSAGDLVAARNASSADVDESAERHFEAFASLMRYSYNDKHMELLEWADEVASSGREDQKMFLRYSIGMLRENYMMNTGMDNIIYIGGREREFSRKFSPFIGSHNIEQLLHEMESALAHISQNGNPRIVFSHFALSVSKLINRL